MTYELIDNLGKQIKELRESVGWSQERLAREAGISRTYLSMLECGTANNPSLSIVMSLRKVLSSDGGLGTIGDECVDCPLATFALDRHEDETGVSGTGRVAYGVVFPNGKTVVAWVVPNRPQSVAVYESVHDMFGVHVGPHGGKTELVWLTLPADLYSWEGFTGI